MDVAVDRESEIPLGTQLAWKLRTLIATGGLSPGARLPGMRELADAAGVNMNTVRAVYGRLEDQGLLASEHGRGTFVSDDAPQRADLQSVATTAAARAREAGIDPRELAAALFVSDPESGPEPAGEPVDERSLRRQLRRDIAEIERELVHLGGPGSVEAKRPRAGAGRLLDTAELAVIRDELTTRLQTLRGERAELRRRAEARRTPDPQPTSRVWGHGGVWTGTGRVGVVRTASYGA
jgi:DNA-binding transcriptional regulator YhcF (GntR family)